MDETNTLPVFTFGNRTRCTYCGDPATTLDHVIPVVTQRKLDRSRREANGPMCWACADCNSHLGAKWFDTFKARCEWCEWRLNKKALGINWTSREIDGLSWELKTYVARGVAKLRWLRYRADWYESREYYLNLENLIWHVQEIKPVSNGNRFILSYFSDTLHDIANLIYRPGVR